MAERYQLPRSCVPLTMRRKDGGYPPSGGLEGGKTRRIREKRRHGHLPKGVTLLLKATLPTCAPNRRGLSLLQHTPSRRKGRAAMQAACNRAKWTRFSGSRHAQHGGPGPRVTQPARQMLHASNCTAARATTAPPRLRNQYRGSRRPSGRPSSASLTRRSMRPKMGRP
jgi:hypothetical protein